VPNLRDEHLPAVVLVHVIEYPVVPDPEASTRTVAKLPA